MSFIDEMLEKITQLAEETEPYADIVYGSDPPINGICMIPSGGMPADTFFDKGQVVKMPILLNGKNKDQQLLIDTLCNIHAALTKVKDYSRLNTEAVQIIDIASITLPTIIGREQNKQWICGSTLEVTFYWRAVDFFNINI